MSKLSTTSMITIELSTNILFTAPVPRVSSSTCRSIALDARDTKIFEATNLINCFVVVAALET